MSGPRGVCSGGRGVCSWGVVCLVRGGVSAPGEGGAWSGGCLLLGGGLVGRGGVPGPGGSAPGGGGGVSQHALRQTPFPPVDRILDTRL